MANHHRRHYWWPKNKHKITFTLIKCDNWLSRIHSKCSIFIHYVLEYYFCYLNSSWKSFVHFCKSGYWDLKKKLQIFGRMSPPKQLDPTYSAVCNKNKTEFTKNRPFWWKIPNAFGFYQLLLHSLNFSVMCFVYFCSSSPVMSYLCVYESSITWNHFAFNSTAHTILLFRLLLSTFIFRQKFSVSEFAYLDR